MKPKRLWGLVAVLGGVVASGILPATTAAGSRPPQLSHLNVGGQPELRERLPVNVVLVGYGAGQVDRRALRDNLPRSYEPVVRSRLEYGVKETLGIKYSYDYKFAEASRTYTDRFFRRLTQLAQPAPLTRYQSDYNKQRNNVLDVAGNHHIDAPTVERWLADNPPAGVDTRRNTIYLINWHGRADFKHHVYTKTDEPDPDTGYNFGKERDSRKIVAWGGTTADDEENGLDRTRRVWFHDLSAGPDSTSGSWNVDDADLDGDLIPDYRIPPAWEYAAGGYRAPAALTNDLAKLIRYVALDLLFTTSPLYPVELPTSRPAGTIDIDSNTYEGWPGRDASAELIKPRLVTDELSELVRRNRLSYDNQDLPYDEKARRCYEGLLTGTPCYEGQTLPPFANLFLFNQENLQRTKDDQGRVDYELPIFNYAVGEGVGSPALGFADSNYQDGTQSFVFNFISPELVTAGYGLSTTMIHEVGHHFGLSHPHDGYDSTSGQDFGPGGETYFAWLGDYSNSMMSYVDLNWDFSQFDRDNMDRFQTAALNEAANKLAAEALAAPNAARAHDELRRADSLVGRAERMFAGHDYRAAQALMLAAYDQVAAGARQAGVDVDAKEKAARTERNTLRAQQPAHGPDPAIVDTLTPEGPRNKP